MSYKNKEDANAATRRSYQKHRDKHLARFKKIKQDLKNYVNDIKSRTVCKICGFNNVLALDFHHREPSTKKYKIAQIHHGSE